MKTTKLLPKLEKTESETIALKLVHIYDLLDEMTRFKLPEIDDQEEVWEAYAKNRQIHHAYFDLYITTCKYATCMRRSRKMKKELETAIKNAEELGLNVY